MIIMLDGVNGTGKSTYANRIKESFGIKTCRVFRSDNKELHWGTSDGELRKELDALKVPINTHIDDLFMADFMLSFHIDAVLDRTISSAIVYGRLYNKMDGWYKEKGNCRRLLNFWMDIIEKCKPPLLYVWLDSEYIVAKERCKGRWFPYKDEYNKLRKEYEMLFPRIRFNKIRIQTGHVEIEEGVNRVMRTAMDRIALNAIDANS